MQKNNLNNNRIRIYAFLICIKINLNENNIKNSLDE